MSLPAGDAENELADRLRQIQSELSAGGIDFLLLGPSTDLLYLTAYDVKPSERLTILVVSRTGIPKLVTPDFELAALETLPVEIEPVGWSDGDDPALVTTALLARGSRTAKIAVGAQLHARFLLGLMAAGMRAELVDGDAVMSRARVRKSEQELAVLREASANADAVFEDLALQRFEGTSERTLVQRIRELLGRHGNDATGSGLAAFGANAAAPHHHSSSSVARPGDAVIVDFGGSHRHYRADITRTLHLGEPTAEFRTVYEVVDEAHAAAFAAVRPGVPAEEVDLAARQSIERAGWGHALLHRTGHGIGLDVHEPPYLVRGDKTPLEPGMTFTIEPGVYLPGRFGVRIEDVVLVTNDAAERLNRSDHRLRVVS